MYSNDHMYVVYLCDVHVGTKSQICSSATVVCCIVIVCYLLLLYVTHYCWSAIVACYACLHCTIDDPKQTQNKNKQITIAMETPRNHRQQWPQQNHMTLY